MLILTRRPGESIAIGDDVLVSVIEVSRTRVRIGIEAPQHVLILRQELREAVKEENRAGYQVRREEVKTAIDSLQKLFRSSSGGPAVFKESYQEHSHSIDEETPQQKE